MLQTISIHEMKVLIVDDSPVNCDVLRNVLQFKELETFVALDGKTGLNVARQAQPDLILLDIMMPEMDGFQVITQLKDNPDTANIPVIFISALSDTEEVVKAFSMGAVDYISKPFRQEEVLSRVETHLRLRKVLQEKQEWIRKLEDLKEQFEIASLTDSMTGLANRRAAYQNIEAELNRTERTHNPFTILLLDIDYFKKINDTYGHLAGDSVLKQMANLFQHNVRKIDTAARWGGEEFIVLLPETPRDHAVKVAEKIRAVIEQEAFVSDGKTIPVTISGGLATCSNGNLQPDELVKKADEALYRAKREGRNRIVVSPD